MLPLRNMISHLIFAMAIFTLSTAGRSEVLELGESQLHGKKDQPEAMTFVSRAPLPVGKPVATWNAAEKIRKEIERGIFEVTVPDV